MKLSLFLTFSAFWLLVPATAQVTEFAPLGAKWYYNFQAFIPPPFGVRPFVVEVVSKEIYQGKSCSKLDGGSGGSETVPEPLYIYEQQDSVFFYSELSSRFELLYDFGAQAGDSWVIGGLNGGDVDSLAIHVDSTSQWLINGQTLKVLHISYPIVPFEWGDRIVAGIENPFFLTPHYGLVEEKAIGLRCYTDAENDFHFVWYPCDTILQTLQVSELDQKPNISVSPNPVHEYIRIEMDAHAAGAIFNLYHITGQRATSAPIIQGTNDLNNLNIKGGIYFWEVVSNAGRLASGKILKTE